MRDKSSRPNNFPDLIAAYDRSFKKLSDAMKNNQVPEGNKNGVQANIISRAVGKMVTTYSNGGTKEEVMEALLLTVDSIDKWFMWTGRFLNDFTYYSILWVVSIAILLDLDQSEFEKLSTKVEKFKIQDRLLNFLISYRQSNWMDNSNQFIQKKPYEKLKRAIDESEESAGILELQAYLKTEVWYDGHKEVAWHNAHLAPVLDSVYTGYWSWEAAALVKVKGWNDEKLKDNEYYPYDAVHW
jgi:hypothetical protein